MAPLPPIKVDRSEIGLHHAGKRFPPSHDQGRLREEIGVWLFFFSLAMCQVKPTDDFHTLKPNYKTSGKEGDKMFEA